MYNITFKNRAGKEMRNLPLRILKKISSSIEHLAENPRPEGSKTSPLANG